MFAKVDGRAMREMSDRALVLEIDPRREDGVAYGSRAALDAHEADRLGDRAVI